MNTLKKYLLWSLIPFIILTFAVTGCFRPDPENWHLLSVFFVIGICSILGILGTLYFYTTKRQAKHASRHEQAILSLCLILTILIPIADLIGVPQKVYLWFHDPPTRREAKPYFFFLSRYVFGLVQLVVVGLLVRTFFSKKQHHKIDEGLS